METGMCVNSRRMGGANVCRRGIFQMEKVFKIATAVLLAAVLFAAAAEPVAAALPAPNFMPGFPLLAGPQVILMWSPVTGAEKYSVFMNGKEVVKGLNAFQAVLPAPSDGGEYTFEVVAIDAAGVPGARSAAGIIKIIQLIPPKELVILPGDKQLQMRWTASSGALIYEVYRRTKGSEKYEMLASVQDTRYTDSALDPKKEYEYAIKAKDVMGKVSGFSKSASAALTVAATGAGDQKRRAFTLNPIPTEKTGFVPFGDAYPADVAIGSKGEALVSSSTLQFSESGAGGPYRTLLKGEKGFNGVGFAPDGKKMFAANGETSEVVELDPSTGEATGRYKVPPPEKGELLYGDGKFRREGVSNPTDVAVDAAGNIYVSDNSNYRLVKLGPDGKYLGTVGWEKGKEGWLVFSPGFVAVDGKGRKYVSSMAQVHVFGPDDKFLAIVGGLGQTVGDFARVKGLVTDKKSRLLAADMQNGTIQIFEWNEEFKTFDPVSVLTDQDKKGNPKVSAPGGIALSPSGGELVVVESMHKYVSTLRVMWDKAANGKQ